LSSTANTMLSVLLKF